MANKFLAIIFTLVIAICSIVAIPKTASALSGSEFNAGRIIDDAVFYNGNSMNASQVQAFLNNKMPVCDTNGSQIYSGSTTRSAYSASKGYGPPFTCMKDFRQDVPAKAADQYCGGFGAGTRSAADIIVTVAQACGISPQVLLVLLQKEQSLITDDWPWSIQYRSATGFGCPDTAECDATYYGFFNQVYSAARGFKYYAANPTFFNYRAGRNNSIQYNPVASCGSSTVYIHNQATANLYIYTPYQPNQAALNNLYGSGDNCSAYGNRNFWRLYNDWFGSPLYNGLPYAHIDGSLVINSGSPTIYLIENGKRRPFLLEQTFYSYGYNPGDIRPANFYDNQLPIGEPVPFLRPGTLFKGSGQTIYSFQLGVNGSTSKQYFTSWETFVSLGYDLGQVRTLPDTVASQIPTGAEITPAAHPYGEVVKDPSSPAVYFLSNVGKRQAFKNADAYTSHRLSFANMKRATAADLALPLDPTPIDFREGTVIKTPSSPAIYVTDLVNGVTVRRALTTWNCFTGFNYKSPENIFNIDTPTINSIPEGTNGCTW